MVNCYDVMTALLFCFEKMASVVGIKFVDESENFDFEKSGKSSRPCRENWSMLYIAESDEGDVEVGMRALLRKMLKFRASKNLQISI